MVSLNSADLVRDANRSMPRKRTVWSSSEDLGITGKRQNSHEEERVASRTDRISNIHGHCNCIAVMNQLVDVQDPQDGCRLSVIRAY